MARIVRSSRRLAHCAAMGRANATHGHARHGSRHPLYHCWTAMLARCENPKNPAWPRYGGRGINVCERWHSIGNFIADVMAEIGARPARRTLDRVDNTGNYEPGNIRWATAHQQAQNREGNLVITAFSKTAPLAAFLPGSSPAYDCAKRLMRKGRPPEVAILTGLQRTIERW